MPRGLRWLNEEGDAYVVSLVRCILGVLLLLSALREVFELLRGPYFGDVYHQPITPELLVPSRAVFGGIVAVQLGLALLVTVGRYARPALLVSAALGIYLLTCDRISYHNNRYALFLFSFLIAFAPCDRAFVWRPFVRKSATQFSPGRGARLGPLWAARLAQVQLAIIYLSSGGSKLLDPDWRGGDVIGDRLRRSFSLAIAKGVPPQLMQSLSDPAVASALSKLAIASELFLVIALFLPRTRRFALWWGVMFHITIEVTSNVELFGWLCLTIYALFATPELRERTFAYDPSNPRAVALSRLVRLTDWLSRFEMRPLGAGPDVSGLDAEAGGETPRRWRVVDRDGTESQGLAGLALLAATLPVLVPLSIPLAVVSRVASRKKDTRVAAC